MVERDKEPIDFQQLVRERQIIVCCGTGGVGKTTTAAALGVLAAREGRRALVMTIDPARRLAQAMGLEDLGNDPQPVSLDAPGSLSAMMLDNKRTFDWMVETYAPDAKVRETIFGNSYYQQLSTTLGGSRELIAMERVLEVFSTDEHDLLIVDTPPAQHALDFLDAPQRLIGLLDGSFTQMLLAPYGVAARTQFSFFRRSSALTLKFLERLTGFEMLADLSNFLLAFSSMFEGVKERSSRVLALMSEPTTTFVLVCAPEPVSLNQAGLFAQRLARDSMDISGVLVNRFHPGYSKAELSATDLAQLREIDQPDRDSLADRLSATLADARELAEADARAVATFSAATVDGHELPRKLVPDFNRDLHSMEDLVAFSDLLK